jgi:uncharacterized protein YdaU (DUF1376 family)
MHFFGLNIQQFNNATRHLSRIERSVYLDLMMVYYDTEEPLVDDFDRLCRLILANSEQERTAVQQVLNEFFTQTNAGWFQERCAFEIEKFHSNNSKKSIAGIESARKRKELLNKYKDLPIQQVLNGCSTDVQLNSKYKIVNNKKEIVIKKTKKDIILFNPESVNLPEWLNPLAWQAFVTHRKKLKKPLTELAAKLAVQKLCEMKAAGKDPVRSIKESIMNDWVGLFEPKGNTQQTFYEKTKIQREEDGQIKMAGLLSCDDEEAQKWLSAF